MAKTRSFLKWAGGKYNCLNEIISALPSGSRLIEPFAGSGVIFMNALFSSYILGESNRDLINIFTHLQNEGDSFIERCQYYFQPKFNCNEQFYELRTQFNTIKKSPRKSALFLYLNRHGFNGLCRYNSKGIFNVPFGRYATPYFPVNEMRQFASKSPLAQFIHDDFRNTFKLAQPGDVIYCDPPYVPITPTNSFAYTKQKFEEKDQIELAELAIKTAAKGIPVIISNHDTEFTRHHYQKAKIRSFPVSRFISCQTSMRQPVMELIAVFK
jgi:DNA adenine methylase